MGIGYNAVATFIPSNYSNIRALFCAGEARRWYSSVTSSRRREPAFALYRATGADNGWGGGVMVG